MKVPPVSRIAIERRYAQASSDFPPRTWPSTGRLSLLLLAMLLWPWMVQADPTGDPAGPAGGTDGMSTTAGCYDAYTGNAQRTVTDIVVPGSAGTMPLAFTRTYNSRDNFTGRMDNPSFADSNWRHSYQWDCTGSDPHQSAPYTINYPNGREVTFQLGQANAPANETFARGPAGINDRLQIIDSNHLRLYLTDGSTVNFALLTGGWHATTM